MPARTRRLRVKNESEGTTKFHNQRVSGHEGEKAILSASGHNAAVAKKKDMAKKMITLRKGSGREGSMEHRATGLHNTRKLLD